MRENNKLLILVILPCLLLNAAALCYNITMSIKWQEWQKEKQEWQEHERVVLQALRNTQEMSIMNSNEIGMIWEKLNKGGGNKNVDSTR